jgi:hypothetical protein
MRLTRKQAECTVVELYRRSIDDDGAVKMAEALKSNHGVVQLLIESNVIGDVGASAIAELLKTNTAGGEGITSLCIRASLLSCC